MKHYLLLSLLAFVGYNATLAQQIIFQDDFEGYTAGSKIAQSAANEYWDTWSGTTGGAEDGTISTDYAASGANSMNISGTNDILLRIGNAPLTEGRYKLSFKMLIAPNSYGYYNALHEFGGANSIWATQTYFRANGNCTVDADGAESAGFNQPTGEWFDVNLVIDLGDDFITYYHADNDEVKSWRWSAGTFGGANPKTLEALNFYAWGNEGTPNFFVDDVVLAEVEKPGDEIVLTGTKNSDNSIDLDWTISGSPENVIVTEEGNVLGNATTNSFSIAKPYPAVHNYQVAAHYVGDGYRFSNIAEVEVEGGKNRDFVVFEVGTGTWCSNCPAAARGVDQMHDEGLDVAILKYHNDDPYMNDDGNERIRYYGITGYPTSFSDGAVSVRGGSFSGNLYSSFIGNYNQRIERRSLYSLEPVSFKTFDDGSYELIISSEELYEYFEGDITLHVALTESNIPDSWQGMSEVDFAVREMYPNGGGTGVNYDAGAFQQTFQFTPDQSYVKENCEIVFFLQEEETKEILNGHVLKLTDAEMVSNTEEARRLQVVVTPNPTVDFINVTGVQEAEGQLFNLNGQLIREFAISGDHQEDLSTVPAGNYILNVVAKEGTFIQKIVKQ